MRPFTRLLTRKCKQTAVYWKKLQSDGSGGFIYDNPIEIFCRWEDKIQIMGGLGDDRLGERAISRALVYVLQDVYLNDLIFLGTLNDLDSGEIADPTTVTNICIIKRFEKTPAMGSKDDFIRKAYLTPWLA